MSKEQHNIPERLNAVRQLKERFGGIAEIPEEELASVDYVRIEATDGWQVIPVEQVALRSLQERLMDNEQTKGPFEQLSFEVETGQGYATSLKPQLILHQVERFLDNSLEDGDRHWAHNTTLDRVERWVHKRVFFIEDGSGERALMRSYSPDVFKGKFVRTVLEDVTGSTNDDLSWSAMVDYFDIAMDTERLSATHVEDAWRKLEILKSRLSDIGVIEKEFSDDLGVFMVDTSTSEDDIESREVPVVSLEQYAPQASLANIQEGGELPSVPLYMNMMADLLSENDFYDVAEDMRRVESLSHARQVIAGALKGCARVVQFKASKKAMLTYRKTLHDPEAIHNFSEELARLNQAQKEAMQTLYGLQALLDIPNLFSQYIRKEITAIQKGLQVARSNETMSIRLDGQPDRDKDRDPGFVSGDCTAGNPLPFEAGVGLYNIKVYLDGEHSGNIYLLDSTTHAGEHVWHLEAIQIPSLRPNWNIFSGKLIDQLASAARENEVELITINSVSHHISNYDYISDSMLTYVGVENPGQAIPDVDDRPTESGAVPANDIERTAVTFPGQVTDSRPFQGEGESQLVVWRRGATV